MNTVIQAFIDVSIIEWAAVFSTALCVWLAGQNKVLSWPVGIVATVLYGILFYDAKLYADTLLQLIFLGTGFYGWYTWGETRSKPPAQIRSVDAMPMAMMTIFSIFVVVAYSRMLESFTDSPAPILDSIVLVFSVLGQLLLMRRYIQTWPTWILVNTVSVPLYISRELYVTAILYAVFWVHAWYAWFKWHKEYESV